MARDSGSGSNRGVLVAIVVVAAVVLGYLISNVALKPPPVEDSAPLEAQLDGKPKDGGSGSDSLESRLGQ